MDTTKSKAGAIEATDTQDTQDTQEVKGTLSIDEYKKQIGGLDRKVQSLQEALKQKDIDIEKARQEHSESYLRQIEAEKRQVLAMKKCLEIASEKNLPSSLALALFNENENIMQDTFKALDNFVETTLADRMGGSTPRAGKSLNEAERFAGMSRAQQLNWLNDNPSRISKYKNLVKK